MTALTLTALVVALIAAVLAPALLRECRRVEQERRRREWLTTSPDFQAFARAFEEFSAEVGRALLPAAREVAAAFAQIARAVTDRPTEGETQ